jgi:hypothetical protein
MICNFCEKELKSLAIDDSGRVIYECSCQYDNNMIIIKTFGDISYYDIYSIIDGKTYNIEGIKDKNKTLFISLGEDMSIFYESEYYYLNAPDPVEEACQILTKIVHLKAFT